MRPNHVSNEKSGFCFGKAVAGVKSAFQRDLCVYRGAREVTPPAHAPTSDVTFLLLSSVLRSKVDPEL